MSLHLSVGSDGHVQKTGCLLGVLFELIISKTAIIAPERSKKYFIS
jgi:hypothetical protein